MDAYTNGRYRSTAGIVIALFLLGAGVFSIVTGVTSLRRFDVLMGVVYIFLAPSMYVAHLKQRLAGTTYRRIYRWALTIGLSGVALVVACGLVLWFGIDTSVAPSTLVEHPWVYNNREVHTSGEIVAGAGACMLEVERGNATASGSARVSQASIYLSSGIPLCTAAQTRRVQARVSGNFYVLGPSKHLASEYVLAGADITVLGAAASGH